MPQEQLEPREQRDAMELESRDPLEWDQRVLQAHQALEPEARELVRRVQWDQPVQQAHRALELEAREPDLRVHRESRV